MKGLHQTKPKTLNEYIDGNRLEAMKKWAPIWMKDTVLSWKQRIKLLKQWHASYTPYFPKSLLSKIPDLYEKKHNEFVENQKKYLEQESKKTEEERMKITKDNFKDIMIKLKINEIN